MINPIPEELAKAFEESTKMMGHRYEGSFRLELLLWVVENKLVNPNLLYQI